MCGVFKSDSEILQNLWGNKEKLGTEFIYIWPKVSIKVIT